MHGIIPDPDNLDQDAVLAAASAVLILPYSVLATVGRPSVRPSGQHQLFEFESPIFKPGHWLKDRTKLKAVLKDAAAEGIKVDALLFGHNHGGKTKHGKWGIPRVYDGGTTGGKRKPSFIRIIEDLSAPDAESDVTVSFSAS